MTFLIHSLLSLNSHEFLIHSSLYDLFSFLEKPLNMRKEIFGFNRLIDIVVGSY
jgi:hypothetical protein